MSASNEQTVYVFPLPTMAHGFAIEDAYREAGMFREVGTPEQQQALHELAQFRTVEASQFVGSAALMQEAMALLEVWGDAYATRRDVPPRRTVSARVALEMAADLMALIEHGHGVSTTFDEYAFFDNIGDLDAA